MPARRLLIASNNLDKVDELRLGVANARGATWKISHDDLVVRLE